MASIRNIIDKLRTTMRWEVLLAFYHHILTFVLSSAEGNARLKERGHVMKQRFEIAQAVTDEFRPNRRGKDGWVSICACNMLWIL